MTRILAPELLTALSSFWPRPSRLLGERIVPAVPRPTIFPNNRLPFSVVGLALLTALSPDKLSRNGESYVLSPMWN
jgi:hypothetical protein